LFRYQNLKLVLGNCKYQEKVKKRLVPHFLFRIGDEKMFGYGMEKFSDPDPGKLPGTATLPNSMGSEFRTEDMAIFFYIKAVTVPSRHF
jgi:hypothetical protein